MATERIHADVTGSVWKIEAQIGDRLKADQTIMIVESMKMEIPVVAPVSGVLTELFVKEGQEVEEGQQLAVIEV